MMRTQYERRLEDDMIGRKVQNILKPFSKYRQRQLFGQHTLTKDEKRIWLAKLWSATIKDWTLFMAKFKVRYYV